jgi:uncharacterized membrane protein YvlD (DUF360 family)
MSSVLNKYRSNFKSYSFHLFLSAVALAIATALVPDVSFVGLIPAAATVVLLSILEWLARPLFAFFARTLGTLAILLISFFGHALLVWLALILMPNVTIGSFWAGFWVAWSFAIIMTIFDSIFLSKSSDVFLSEIMSRVKVGEVKKSDEVGFIFVQLDGVPRPVLDWQLKAGNLPNIASILEEEYSLKTWHTQIPSSTPISQAGILFGNYQDIPAFRWYEKDAGRLMVANQANDAAIIEKRLSNGRGLLADGGISVGNLFSGDAKKNIMVMSKLHEDRESVKTMRDYTAYFSTPYGFMRGFVLSIAEIVKEIYQARKQISKDVTPRIHRGGSYVLLRAATNVLLRDLQLTITIQNMMKGVNSLYVDFLDYDEVAHHAGVARAESLQSLGGLDQVVGILMSARKLAPRPYEIILVSDHGQSQGTTFKQLHDGRSLQELVAQLTDDSHVDAESAPPEQYSGATYLLGNQSTKPGVTGSTARKLAKSVNKSASTKTNPSEQLSVVTGSGNLGTVWLTKLPNRATKDIIDAEYPRLIEGLLGAKGIGFIITRDKKGTPICHNTKGSINLKTGEVTGISPLDGFHPTTANDFFELANNEHAGDIIINSSYNPETGEVHAFEELVGNHGGVGGWQTEAILLHPKRLKVPKRFLKDGDLHSATTLHKLFVYWLEEAGHRKNLK